MASCSACGAPLADAARFCHACGEPVEQSTQVGEERKLATVLFADLVGSTALTASQDPERTRALLQRFYDAMQTEIEGAGGTVEKFVGDAVMAVFGAPAAQEDHAERALHAALSMRRRLEELFGEELQLRIGVNTGEVVVGRPREGSSFVTGDAVNGAARLEQAAAPGEILVGERTVAAARGAFEFGEPQTVEAKGKEGGAACRRLLRALSLMRPRGVAGLHRAFVGRESELELLQATYRRAVELREPTGPTSRCSTCSSGSSATCMGRCSCSEPRGRSCSTVGRPGGRPAQRVDALAGGALRGGVGAPARRAARGRAAAAAERDRRRRCRGEPVLRRGAFVDADRPGRARA